METKYRYEMRLPMAGATPEQLASGTGYFTVCCADTPEGAADVVRVLLAHRSPECDHVKVEVRVQG